MSQRIEVDGTPFVLVLYCGPADLGVERCCAELHVGDVVVARANRRWYSNAVADLAAKLTRVAFDVSDRARELRDGEAQR